MESIKKVKDSLLRLKRFFGSFVGGLGICLLLVIATPSPASAQSEELQQLILDITKLAQFKTILSDMKTGYQILTQGYGEVKSIAEGNFSLHSTFLNGLMAVSPEVRKYGRIADIISDQLQLVSEGKAALSRFKASGRFSAAELVYLNQVFARLLSQSLDNLTTLANVITADKLRMSDDERLRAIDQVYADTNGKLVFLRSFNSRVSVLELQRAKVQRDIQMLKQLY